MKVPLVPPQPVRISIVSTPAHLPIVRAAAGEICRLIGFAKANVDAVVVAVDEALANIIKHAYDGRGDEPIDVTFTALCDGQVQSGLEVVLEDRGKAVDAASLHGRDLDDVRPGGLGTHIMGACMDVLNYAPRAGGGTRLTMIKYLRAEPAAMKAQLTGGTRG